MTLRTVLASLIVLLLAACASSGGNARKLEEALYAYQGAVRWGSPTEAMAFVQPSLREQLQPSSLQQQRMQQYQITGYYVQGRDESQSGELRQVVELRVVNKHSMVERSVIDRQVWRWSEEDQAWWLTTGLPDFAPR